MKIKTKFDTIIKIKKQKVQEIEREIGNINQQIVLVEEKKNEIQKDINSFEYPKEGNFAVLTQFKQLLADYFILLKQKKDQIAFLENQKAIVLDKLKEANIEFEKMNYLRAEEIKKIIQKQKHKEAKEIDEIALMLFANKKD